MGASSGCQTLERFSDALLSPLNQLEMVTAGKVHDDYMFIADSHASCQKALDTFNGLCDSIGGPLAPKRQKVLQHRLSSKASKVTLPQTPSASNLQTCQQHNHLS